MFHKKTGFVALFVLGLSVFSSYAGTLDVSLRIRNDLSDEKIINRENLLTIRKFMITNNFRSGYSNMYSENNAFQTKRFSFFLNPGSLFERTLDKMAESEFQSLVIRDPEWKNQYCHIEFNNEYEINIRIPIRFPKSNVELTATQIRDFASGAIQEILAEISKDTPVSRPQSKLSADTGSLQEAIKIAIPALYNDKMTQSFSYKQYILTSAQQILKNNKWIWFLTFKPKELLPDDPSKGLMGAGGEVFVNVNLNTKETVLTYGE